jgi:hypothetical protein
LKIPARKYKLLPTFHLEYGFAVPCFGVAVCFLFLGPPSPILLGVVGLEQGASTSFLPLVAVLSFILDLFAADGIV